MNTERLEQIIRNWNPETDSVKILQEAISQSKIDIYDTETPGLDEAIVHIEWAEKYYDEYAFGDLILEYNIITIDFEGNCLLYDKNEVKNVSELKRVGELDK